MQLITLISYLFLSFSKFYIPINEGNIFLTIENIKHPKGNLRIAVFQGRDNFLKDGKAIQAKDVPVNQVEKMNITFDNLPYGDYTIAIYHDINDNKKLDKNLFGVPTEPYGFSNNAKSKWGPPKYEEANFKIEKEKTEAVIAVKVWTKQ